MIEDFNELSIHKDEPAETKPGRQEVVPEISFHLISGSSHPQTIRVLGRIGNKTVTVFIDGGSTHNIINQALVTK